MKRKLLLAFAIGLYFSFIQFAKAQSYVAIVLNEYSASNTTGPVDNFGQLSDWVEIYNAHTSPVSLNGYYLSNDRNNLFKWKFPAGFNLSVGEHRLVWLTGKNTTVNGNYHANFTLDQCKNQWLILSTSQGAIRDSVFVQKTKAGHSRGRVDITTMGVGAWRLYTTNSHLAPNPTVNNYNDYAPKPFLYPTTLDPGETKPDSVGTNKGRFEASGAQIYKIKINGFDYDTINFPCFNVYYTMGGNYPTPANWTRYMGGMDAGITLAGTEIIRAVTVPVANVNTLIACSTGFLESFCETNTYFLNPDHQTFDKRFGVVSIALNQPDSLWFASQGLPASTTVHVEYYDEKKQWSEGYAIINRPPNETWATKQKGFYISIDDRRGFGCNFEGSMFNVEELGKSDRKVFPTLHLKSGDFESLSELNVPGTSNGTALRDVFYQSLAAKYNLNVSPLHIKPVITFVNGKYWGVSNLTEVYDKYYENYYNNQSLDSLDLCFYNNGDASVVSYPDGSVATFSNNFRSAVYNVAATFPLKASDANSYYARVMSQLDKSSFIDYMIMNSFGLNSDLWNYNVAFAKGGRPNKPGTKWHYYLWNMPTIFNYTAPVNNPGPFANANITPCYLQSIGAFTPSPKAHNSHGYIFSRLMDLTTGNPGFRQEYISRYQDLLNGPFKCENLLKHWQLIDTLYQVEMRCHEDPACPAGPGVFRLDQPQWDTNMVRFKKVLTNRCFYMEKAFNNSGCYGMAGPFAINVDVTPAGAGNVKLNTNYLNTFPWTGHYFQAQMSFKAIPTSTNYVFNHWEFKKHTPKNPLSMDSVVVTSWAYSDDVVAVFTDITNPVGGENIPTGFTPNDDGLNDYFGPLGSVKYSTDYQFTIWNRWGQEVFRSTDPNALGWDGRYNGQQVPTGVYAYVITYKNVYGESKVVKNNVTLTR